MRILITGSRTWESYSRIEEALDHWVERYVLTVIHGACPRGADAYAALWCRRNSVAEEAHPADWQAFGKRAGFIRNAEMVNSGIDLCLAFIANNSKGASHTAALAEKHGITTVRYTK